MLDDGELKFETNDGDDWSNSDDNEKNDRVSQDNVRHPNWLAEPNHNPPKHDVGHIKME